MAIYELRPDQIRTIERATFAELGLREREDLQRLLRDRIEIVAPDCLVISEEFGRWDESKRRIDLLAIDRDANLVIIELKRTDTGGHMELQSIRYAAMVSTMTAEQAIDAFRSYLRSIDQDPSTAEQQIIDHLGWDEIDEEQFGSDVRVVLVSAEFSRELTTAVMWLNERALDIRCVRLRPHRDGDRALIDVQQVIPLPEAAEYQIRVREKHVKERVSRQSEARELKRFDVTVGTDVFSNLPKRRAILAVVKALCERGATPNEIRDLIYWREEQLFIKQDGVIGADDMHDAIMKGKLNGTYGRGPRRYLCKNDDDLILQNGCTYAFSGEWGKRTEEAIRILLDAFPEAGIQYARSE